MVIWSNENAKFDLISWKVENEENGIKAISWYDTDYDNEILSNTLKKDELAKIAESLYNK